MQHAHASLPAAPSFALSPPATTRRRVPIFFLDSQVLNDATEKVKEKSCYALEAFCENLGDDILPFLQPLLERLTGLLQQCAAATAAANPRIINGRAATR